MLQFALRLGERPRAVVTTTPAANALLGASGRPRTVTTRAPTAANRMHLAASFRRACDREIWGTRTGRQELDGELVTDLEGALWTWDMLEAARAPRPLTFDRVVVAIDLLEISSHEDPMNAGSSWRLGADRRAGGTGSRR